MSRLSGISRRPRVLAVILAWATLPGSIASADNDGLAEADYGIYRYFAWLMEPPLLTGIAAGPPIELHPGSPLDRARLDQVRATIERELAVKGYQRLDGSPDFLILLTVGSRDLVDAPIYSSLRERWGLRSHYAGLGSDVYADGILAIDIFDRRNRKPVWHRRSEEPITGVGVIDTKTTIDRVVGAILRPFPQRQLSLDAPQEVGFTYAEGYTSQTPDGSVDLSFRAFSLSSTPCAGVPVTGKVVAAPAVINLRVGERYFMPNVTLRAYSETGEFTPRVPLSAQMHYLNDVLSFESDNDRNFSVIAIGEGEGTAYFQTGCGKSHRVDIPIVVTR